VRERHLWALVAVVLALLSSSAVHSADPADMTDDIAYATTDSSKQVAWRTVVPGTTRLDEVLADQTLAGDMVQRDERDGRTTLLFPPACEKGEKRVNVQFGRVVEVVFDAEGVCEYVHIGGFFPETRPAFELFTADLGLQPKLIAKASRYSGHSSVYDAPDAGMWFIVANAQDRTGNHQIIAMRYYKAGTPQDLPTPKVQYKR